LINAKRNVGIVTNKKDDIDLIYEEFDITQVFVLFADLKNFHLLEKLNIKEASMIFFNLKDDTDKLIATLNVKKNYPGINFMVTVDNGDLKETFYSAGVTYVLSKNEIAAKLIASYIFEPDVADYASDLLAPTKEEHDYDIQQFKIIESNPYLNQTYGEVFRDLKEKHNVISIGICKKRQNNKELIKVPEDSVKVELGDYLIMILNGQTEKIISNLFQIKEGLI